MRVTLIHNPNAGKDSPLSGDELIRLVRNAGHSTIYQSSIGDTWHKVLEESAEIVAVAGGDGIVGKVAKRLVGGGVPIAVLPMGTANNIARALGLISYSTDQLIAGWATARRIKFDVGAASGPWGSTYFIEGVGMGLFTDTMSRLDARKNVDLAHHSAAEKKIMSVLEFMNFRLEGGPAYRLRISLDEHDLSGEYILVEAMNIPSVGPNLCLAPTADPGDGVLDVVLIADHERSRMRSYLLDQLEGKSDRTVLTVHRGRHLHIECEWFPIHIDDEIKLKKEATAPLASSVMDVTIEPAALEMLVPA